MSTHTYESINSEGYVVAILPVRIKRGSVGSAKILSVKVRNFSTENLLSSVSDLSFKLNGEFINQATDFNVLDGSLIIEDVFPIGAQDPGIYNIPHDNSVTFNPPVEDYNLGVQATLNHDDHYLIFNVSYEPIHNFGVNFGESNAEVIVDYLDTNDLPKVFNFFVKGTATPASNLSGIDGVELDLVSTVYTFDINTIKID